MSRVMYGSGKFVPSDPEYSHIASSSIKKSLKFDVPLTGWPPPVQPILEEKLSLEGDRESDKHVNIPEVPENPDKRPLFLQYAEEYFGRYWFVSVVIVLYLLFRKK